MTIPSVTPHHSFYQDIQHIVEVFEKRGPGYIQDANSKIETLFQKLLQESDQKARADKEIENLKTDLEVSILVMKDVQNNIRIDPSVIHEWMKLPLGILERLRQKLIKLKTNQDFNELDRSKLRELFTAHQIPLDVTRVAMRVTQEKATQGTFTLLSASALMGETDEIEHLLARKCNVNYVFQCDTLRLSPAVLVAASSPWLNTQQKKETVCLLLKHGANPMRRRDLVQDWWINHSINAISIPVFQFIIESINDMSSACDLGTNVLQACFEKEELCDSRYVKILVFHGLRAPSFEITNFFPDISHHKMQSIPMQNLLKRVMNLHQETLKENIPEHLNMQKLQQMKSGDSPIVIPGFSESLNSLVKTFVFESEQQFRVRVARICMEVDAKWEVDAKARADAKQSIKTNGPWTSLTSWAFWKK